MEQKSFDPEVVATIDLAQLELVLAGSVTGIVGSMGSMRIPKTLWGNAVSQRPLQPETGESIDHDTNRSVCHGNQVTPTSPMGQFIHWGQFIQFSLALDTVVF